MQSFQNKLIQRFSHSDDSKTFADAKANSGQGRQETKAEPVIISIHAT